MQYIGVFRFLLQYKRFMDTSASTEIDSLTIPQPPNNGRCAVEQLVLTAFRNYSQQTIEPAGRSVVLTGANGAGKTNILEALSLLAPGRGMRGATLSQLQSQSTSGAQGWGVAATIRDARGLQRQFGTGVQADKPDKRVVRLDGELLRGQSALTHHFALLWQTPQMDQLFTGGMSERRIYFDRMVSCFSPEHSSLVAKYDYLRRERRQLLSHSRPDTQWLGSIERKMAESSLAIAAARVEVAQHLTSAIATLNPVFPKAVLRLHGFAEQALIQGTLTALDIEDELRAQLSASRPHDAQTGRASHGAHRFELLVDHQEKNMEAAYCSTGEQKALMLSLLLSQCLAMKQRLSRVPILLLDEVIAHLDEHRREALFTLLLELNVQSWMTGTDVAPFQPHLADCEHYHVSKGKLTTCPALA